MSDTDFGEGHRYTVEEFEQDTEGREFNAANPSQKHWTCDFCSTGVPYSASDRAAGYLADRVINDNAYARRVNQERKLTTLATYCEECAHDRVYFPCEGYCEVRIRFDLTADRLLENVEVTDISPRSDGIPWDPKDLSEKITGMPFDVHDLTAEEFELWGPENMVTFFLAVSGKVDIREVVRWDGSVDPKALGRARKAYNEYMEKSSQISSRSESRREFRDRVRSQRGDSS